MCTQVACAPERARRGMCVRGTRLLLLCSCLGMFVSRLVEGRVSCMLHVREEPMVGLALLGVWDRVRLLLLLLLLLLL